MDPLSEDSAARGALAAVAAIFRSQAGVLFELSSPEGCFKQTAGFGSVRCHVEFSANSLLPRWLRVNNQVLEVPDAIGVCEALLPSDKKAMSVLGAGLAVPLLVDEELVAWAVLRDYQPIGSPSRTLPVATRDAASTLKSARTVEQKRAQTEVVMRSNRLTMAGQMAAGIAHEVRNPLAAVRSIVQLVRADAVPKSEQPRLLDNVIAEVDRVNGVLSGMMGLGRPSPAREETVDFTVIAQSAAGFCRSYAMHHSLTIETSLAESLWVRGDAHELRQVLVNLLLNACQASQSGQPIVIETALKREDGAASWAVARVIDRGEGMPPDVVARVFEPFFTTKKDGGGLGLSICREAIQRHGGNISISTEVGAGSTVSLELPLLTHHGANPGR
jgi:signal transduction histidine kinase